MADQTKRREAVVFSADPGGLTDAQVKHLQDTFGLKMGARSSVDAVNRALADLVAAQDFDRTNPGYDRIFDRTAGTRGDASVINPVQLEDRIRSVADSIINERTGNK